MSKSYSIGSEVSWSWGSGHGSGKIKNIYDITVHKTIEGASITRHGTLDNPAYYIEQKNGGHVLKLHSELTSS